MRSGVDAQAPEDVAVSFPVAPSRPAKANWAAVARVVCSSSDSLIRSGSTWSTARIAATARSAAGPHTSRQ
jgi:hypothetical protein